MKKLCLLLAFLLVLLASCASPAPEKNLTCYLEVLCDEALSSEALDDEKSSLLPQDGIIIANSSVNFAEGDTVFDVLTDTLREKNIQFEFSTTPGAGSKYIEGISNLYQFDCGEFSGWSYLVNGEMAQVSASEYLPSVGDKITFYFESNFMEEFPEEA